MESRSAWHQLRCLVQKIQSFTPSVIPRDGSSTIRRACVAVVLRMNYGNKRRNKGLIAPTVEKFLTQTAEEDIRDVEVLLIKRAERPDDPWSGHVALPGGRQEKGESDFKTVIREAKEEVGIILDSSDFACLGQLDDRVLSPRGQQSLVLRPYVFVHLGSYTPKAKLDRKEVAKSVWIPLSSVFHPSEKDKNILDLQMERTTRISPIIKWILSRLVGVKCIQCHTIKLDDFFSEKGVFLWGITLEVLIELFSIAGFPVPFEGAIGDFTGRGALIPVVNYVHRRFFKQHFARPASYSPRVPGMLKVVGVSAALGTIAFSLKRLFSHQS